MIFDAVGDPRDGPVVVGGLGDRAGHVGAVAVRVVGVAVAVDEVAGVHEGGAAEVGRAAVAPR